MEIKVKVKDGNKKLEALKKVESLIAEAKRELMWALDGELKLEIENRHDGDGLEKN